MAELNIGDQAPSFTLPNQKGEMVSLDEFKGKKALVVYFYPKNETPGCTAEACGFRDSYEDFLEAGAEVIGISADSTKSHQKFASNRDLPFILLSDRNHKVRKAYGVKSLLGILPARETFVLDNQGIVRHKFASQGQIGRHIKDALTIVQELSDKERS
ncbi:MAG: peroxiredoxin [Bacteroidia bacterium]|nr:peroxiredoxin [Bacteroidia bacterium]